VNTTSDNIEDKHPGIYKDIGKLKDQTVTLHINKDVKPVAQKPHRTPFHLRRKVEKEINKMLQDDIIEEVRNEATPWISPIVTPPKKYGDVRVCVDMRQANKAIERERRQMPTIDELIHDLNGTSVFSKLVLSDSSKVNNNVFNAHGNIFIQTTKLWDKFSIRSISENNQKKSNN